MSGELGRFADGRSQRHCDIVQGQSFCGRFQRSGIDGPNIAGIKAQIRCSEKVTEQCGHLLPLAGRIAEMPMIGHIVNHPDGWIVSPFDGHLFDDFTGSR